MIVENDFTIEPADEFADDWLAEQVVGAFELKLILALDGSVLGSACMPLSCELVDLKLSCSVRFGSALFF